MAPLHAISALPASSRLDKQPPDIGLRKSRHHEDIKTLTMKDMLNQQKAIIQAIKIEHQFEWKGDLARKQRKAVVLSAENKLRQ